MRGRIAAALALIAAVAIWALLLLRAPEHAKVPADLRVDELTSTEPTEDQLESLRKSIEEAAKKRKTTLKIPVMDGGPEPSDSVDLETAVYQRWVDRELLRRAETGESIPSDGSFDPNEAMDRLKAGEGHESVFGRPDPGP